MALSPAALTINNDQDKAALSARIEAIWQHLLSLQQAQQENKKWNELVEVISSI